MHIMCAFCRHFRPKTSVATSDEPSESIFSVHSEHLNPSRSCKEVKGILTKLHVNIIVGISQSIAVSKRLNGLHSAYTQRKHSRNQTHRKTVRPTLEPRKKHNFSHYFQITIAYIRFIIFFRKWDFGSESLSCEVVTTSRRQLVKSWKCRMDKNSVLHDYDKNRYPY